MARITIAFKRLMDKSAFLTIFLIILLPAKTDQNYKIKARRKTDRLISTDEGF